MSASRADRPFCLLLPCMATRHSASPTLTFRGESHLEKGRRVNHNWPSTTLTLDRYLFPLGLDDHSASSLEEFELSYYVARGPERTVLSRAARVVLIRQVCCSDYGHALPHNVER